MVIHSLIECYGDKIFNGLDMTKLGMDDAYLVTSTTAEGTFYLYSGYKDCINCPLTDQIGSVESTRNITTIIPTGFQKLYKVATADVDVLNITDNIRCNIDTKFGEFGVYHLTVGDTTCTLEVLKEPVNIYLPILTVFIIYLLFFLLIKLSVLLIKKLSSNQKDDLMNADAIVKKERVKSLDTFRGITIALMVFVNYGGGGYKFMEHAIWNGLHIADLVFPWFLWIMGVCIPMSIKSTIKSDVSTGHALLRITRRSATLFLIGLFLGGSSNLNEMRIFGVLQRFGICYFVVASACFLSMKYLSSDEDIKPNNFRTIVSDILRIKALWILAGIVTGIHTILLFAVPFENCPSGYLGPGGYHENAMYMECTGGFTGYVDRVILGQHLYRWAEIRQIYSSQAFDPEGILGCLPSIVQVIIGVQAGITLMTFKKHKARLVRWSAWAVILGIIGGGLCGFSKESGVIPLNKQLWSLSFVLVTSCLAFILLSLCYILVDVTKFWGGKPFLYAGMNAIVIYIGHSLLYSNFPIRWEWHGNNTHFLDLLENVWATSAWILISYFLYKKKWFLTI